MAVEPGYGGLQATLLAADLVELRALMTASGADAAAAYARCGAAGFAASHDYRILRRVRTAVDATGGVWHANAVYTLSKSLPPGRATIDAKVALGDCEAQGIPTV